MHQSDFSQWFWYIAVSYSIISALVSAVIARTKQRDQGNWFLLGIIFGIFAISALLLMKKLPDELAPGNNLLLNPDRHLRSGWRVIIFLVISLVVNSLLVSLARLSRVVPEPSILFLFYIAVLVSTVVMIKYIDSRRFVSVGFPYHGAIFREIGLGFLIGTVMICLVGGFEIAFGAVKLSLRSNLSIILLVRNFGLSFLFFGFFALGEELLFRGYPFQALIEGMGNVGAIIFMSVIFGLLHSGNPEATVFSTANTILAGVWLSVAYLKTRTLYFPFGAHFAWNLVQSFFLSLPVSGLLTNRTIFVPTDFGPDWFTGGRYGPEAGVGTTVVLIAATVFFILDKRIKPAYDYVALKERVAAK
ncbi:MAG TPA: type II CAAX endopeptidase family protein [Candidatus Kryptonia bacterium]